MARFLPDQADTISCCNRASTVVTLDLLAELVGVEQVRAPSVGTAVLALALCHSPHA